MKTIQDKLQAEVRRLLAEKKVDLILGFERAPLSGRTRPCVIRSPDEGVRLVWDNTCSNNLAVYLPDYYRRKPMPKGQTPPPPPRIGIVVKGCDGLSVAQLIRERQVPREALVMIAMPCQGIRDPATGALFPGCTACLTPVSELADVRIGGESRPPAPEGSYADVEAFARQTSEERWRHFSEEMAKCIRCYACREACPNCYCRECFADRTQPRWIGAGNERSDTMLYHIGRLVRQAGRCVGCEACVRACPVGVDLRLFTRKVIQDAEELFGFRPGFDVEQAEMLSTFQTNDREDFLTDPEKKT